MCTSMIVGKWIQAHGKSWLWNYSSVLEKPVRVKVQIFQSVSCHSATGNLKSKNMMHISEQLIFFPVMFFSLDIEDVCNFVISNQWYMCCPERELDVYFHSLGFFGVCVCLSVDVCDCMSIGVKINMHERGVKSNENFFQLIWK